MAVSQNNFFKFHNKYLFFFLLIRAITCVMGVEDQNIALARTKACLMTGKATDVTC